MVKITFSWDDGALEDLKIMDLSLKYSIPGIFFIPATNTERKVMTDDEIRLLDLNHFEIGAHTLSHTYLTQVPLKKANEEIIGGKVFIEQVLGRSADHFCFPGGKYNSEILQISKQYFKTSRTADTCSIKRSDSFLVKPTFHFYDRGRRSLIINGLRNSLEVTCLVFNNTNCRDYFVLINRMILDLSHSSNTYYIMFWGHSWEIEKFHLWSKLEDLFQLLNTNFQESLLAYSDFIR